MATKGNSKADLFGKTRDGQDEARKEHLAVLKNLEEEMEDVDKEMDQLRAVYELYFMGVERREPVTQRDALRARIRKIRETKIRLNTANKFKMQTLQARMISLENYWGRVMRARENGTYHRDVQKARRRQLELEKQHQAETMAGEGLPPENQARMGKEDGEELGSDQLEPSVSEAATADRGPKSGTNRPKGGVGRPRVRSAEDLDEPKLRQLYQTYVTAKRRCGERVELRYEDMASSLKKQVPKLMKQTGASSIEFKVVIKKGAAVLKAIPRTK